MTANADGAVPSGAPQVYKQYVKDKQLVPHVKREKTVRAPCGVQGLGPPRTADPAA